MRGRSNRGYTECVPSNVSSAAKVIRSCLGKVSVMGNLSRDEETEIQLNEMQIIHFHLFFNYFVALFSVDGAFVSVISELLDISTPNSTKKYQEGHKSQIFSQKLKSGNTEVAFMLRVLRKLEANLHSTLQMV